MHENLPRWDIEPEVRPGAVIPVPEYSDKDWCVLVNYLYGGKGYKVEVFAATYRISKTTNDGRVIPAEYTLHAIRDSEEELTPHLITGIFKSVEIKLEFATEPTGGPVIQSPFARLEFAHDVDEGTKLGHIKGQDVLVPLNRMNALTLEMDNLSGNQ